MHHIGSIRWRNCWALSWVALLWWACPSLSAADTPGTGGADAVLHLVDGEFVSGSLIGSEEPSQWRWQGSHFTRPFEFRQDVIDAVHYPVPSPLPKSEGEYGFELAGGDVLFGSLVALSDDAAELDVSRFGRLHVRRDHLRRFYVSGGQDLVYLGPTGLTGWTESPPTKRWRDEGGHPSTDRAGASLYGDFALPPQAAIEFELSWKDKPDFVFALGVNEAAASLERAFRFEVWFRDLVVQREVEREADVASVQVIQPGAGRLHVQVYLDQPNGSLLVFSPEGTPLANMTLVPRKPEVLGGLRLTNKKGDVRLERLRIARWNGAVPLEVQANKSRLHRTDGSIVYGQLVAFDAAAKQFTLREDQTETKLASAQVASGFLSRPDETAPRTVRAIFFDGTKLSGELTGIEDGHISLSSPGVTEPLRLKTSELCSLIVLRRDNSKPAHSPDGRLGMLELGETRLRGWLMEGREQPESSCLIWQPEQSESSSPLRPDGAGRIVYRVPAAPAKPAPQPQPAPQMQGFGGAFRRVLGGGKPAAASRVRTLHLRSGDTIPAEIANIGEEGVDFRTPLSTATFVKHDQIKAAELVPVVSPPKLTKAKRERFLTLPRGQRDSPPTHLICSTNGDMLRGRVLDMDDKEIHVEVRLETKTVPRDRVALIIWLHADELSSTDPADQASPPVKDPLRAATRVQVFRRDGLRLTFFPEQFSNGTLSGRSDVLGACQAEISDADQLLIGDAIEKSASDLVYHKWKLRHATEPKFAQESQGGTSPGPLAGTESDLVGKPAPDFQLDILKGKKFHLADHKGDVVVLDFWATWCGPCLQFMPQVDRVVSEFKDQRVRLIAVNLEEAPQQITSTLERHKLAVEVALDRDGVVAAKYQAMAIPQTVVIDREGNVSRVFVGGGPQVAEQLREAISKLAASTSSE